MDAVTGRMLNNDLEFYKLAGIKDIGEILVHLEIDEINDKRGVIGLGEPPVVGGIAAISNAVANAIGVRSALRAADADERPECAEREDELMQPFEYASPKTLKEALALLGSSWSDAAVLAGGTDLISLMKDEVMTPKRVVNIEDIAELKGITKTAAGVRIRALATVDEVLTSPLIRASFPALVEAARGVASPQIRNMGTFGGDLCQRPRCWYFRAGFGLIARYQGKDLVAEGDNRFHAIFATGPAKFVSASSFGPALVALGAKIRIASPSGTREVEAAKFFVAPTSNDMREVDLKPNEILTEVIVPATGARNATYEVRQKEALDWPLATASVALTMKGTTVASGPGGARPRGADAMDQRSGGEGHRRQGGDRGNRRNGWQGCRGRCPAAQHERLQSADRRCGRQARADGRRRRESLSRSHGHPQSRTRRSGKGHQRPLREPTLEGALHRGRVGSDGPAQQRPRLLVRQDANSHRS